MTPVPISIFAQYRSQHSYTQHSVWWNACSILVPNVFTWHGVTLHALTLFAPNYNSCTHSLDFCLAQPSSILSLLQNHGWLHRSPAKSMADCHSLGPINVHRNIKLSTILQSDWLCQDLAPQNQNWIRVSPDSFPRAIKGLGTRLARERRLHITGEPQIASDVRPLESPYC